MLSATYNGQDGVDGQGVVVELTYLDGYTGPTTITQDLPPVDLFINPWVSDLLEFNFDTENGQLVNVHAKRDNLPTGIEWVNYQGSTTNDGQNLEVQVTYSEGYTGDRIITGDLARPVQSIKLSIDDLLTGDVNPVFGGYSNIYEKDSLPEGVEYITFHLHPNNVDGSGLSVNVFYQRGFTGPSVIEGALPAGVAAAEVVSDIHIHLTVEELLDTVVDEVNGVYEDITVSSNLPHGVESATFTFDAATNAMGQNINVNVVYEDGFTGADVISGSLETPEQSEVYAQRLTQEQIEAHDNFDATAEQAAFDALHEKMVAEYGWYYERLSDAELQLHELGSQPGVQEDIADSLRNSTRISTCIWYLDFGFIRWKRRCKTS